MKNIIILTLILWITSCDSQVGKNIFEHNYITYWDKYSLKELRDTLFSDTLIVNKDVDGRWTQRQFYADATTELLADLQDDIGKTDSLYPQASFDRITILKLRSVSRITLTDEQAKRFLETINNPVSFHWGESTFESGFEANFMKNNEIVGSLLIEKDMASIEANKGWPKLKKMKSGYLKSESKDELVKLLNAILD